MAETIFKQLGTAVYNKLESTKTEIQTVLDSKVDSSMVLTSVPADAVFTDTETLTSLTIVGNELRYTDENGQTTSYDLSNFLDDTNLARIVSGTYDSATQTLVFSRDDNTTFSVDASMFFDDTNMVTSVAGKVGTVTLNTSDISEGSNLYFTTQRSRNSISVAGTLTYDPSTGVILGNGKTYVGQNGVTVNDTLISIGQPVSPEDNVKFKSIATGTHTMTDAVIDSVNGGIQVYTMTEDTLFTIIISEGENITFHLIGSNVWNASWQNITWIGGGEPVLIARDVVTFWKLNGEIFGAYVGDY